MYLKDPPFDTMFDRLTATAEHLHMYLAPDYKGADDWLAVLKEKTCFFTDYHASQMMAEALEDWKVFQIRECSKELEDTIHCAVAASAKSKLRMAAEQVGLTLTEEPHCMPCRNLSCGARRAATSSPARMGQQQRRHS